MLDLVEEVEIIDGIIIVVVSNIGCTVVMVVLVDNDERTSIIIVENNTRVIVVVVVIGKLMFLIIVVVVIDKLMFLIVVVVVVAVTSLNRCWDGCNLRKKARISGIFVSQIVRIVLTWGRTVTSSCMYSHSGSQTQGNKGGQ